MFWAFLGNAEVLTILCLTCIAMSSIFRLPPDGAEKVALTLGGVLGGYLTKTAVDVMKNVIKTSGDTDKAAAEQATNPVVVAAPDKPQVE